MPLQNRVDPFGKIIAIKARGLLMGNRGLLHNQHQQLVKPFQLKRWIICVLDFKDRQRQVMRPGHYTELFFKDEPSALAAGHRPCAECQRSKFNSFKSAWSKGNQTMIGKIEELDEILHTERVEANYPKRKLNKLPDGVFVKYDEFPHLWYDEKLYPWSFEKYANPVDPTIKALRLLTPPSTVKALDAGYQPDILTI